MYQQSNPAAGAKWLFWLALIILVAVFSLGVNIKDAKWLNGKIASATADQMSLATNIEQQKSELDLQILKHQTELQIAHEKQLAEFDNKQKQLEMNALMVADTQKEGFRSSLYNTINLGLMALMIAISVVLVSLGITASFGLHKIFATKAQLVQLSQTSTTVTMKSHHQPSSAVQIARKRERQEREVQIKAKRNKQIFTDSKTIWPLNDGKANIITPGDYPWAR